MQDFLRVSKPWRAYQGFNGKGNIADPKSGTFALQLLPWLHTTDDFEYWHHIIIITVYNYYLTMPKVIVAETGHVG